MKQVWWNKNNYTQGITLVEIIVGVSLLSIIVVSVMSATRSFVELKEGVIIETKSLYLAEEGIETIRFLRDEDWTTFAALAVDTELYLETSTTTVAVTTTPERIDDEFTRLFVLRDVYRDNTTDDIVASTTGSSYVDAGSRWVEVSVGHPKVGTTTLATLLANIFDI